MTQIGFSFILYSFPVFGAFLYRKKQFLDGQNSRNFAYCITVPRTFVHDCSLELGIRFNCHKFTVVLTWRNLKTKMFSTLLQSHKMHVIWAFSQTEMTYFPTLLNTSTNKIPTLLHTWSMKKLLLLGRTSLYRSLPPRASYRFPQWTTLFNNLFGFYSRRLLQRGVTVYTFKCFIFLMAQNAM